MGREEERHAKRVFLPFLYTYASICASEPPTSKGTTPAGEKQFRVWRPPHQLDGSLAWDARKPNGLRTSSTCTLCSMWGASSGMRRWLNAASPVLSCHGEQLLDTLNRLARRCKPVPFMGCGLVTASRSRYCGVSRYNLQPASAHPPTMPAPRFQHSHL